MSEKQSKTGWERKLYRWQEEALSYWEQNDFRGIVEAVTGSGKTRLALAAIERLRQGTDRLYIKIVVPTIPLAGQWIHAVTEAAECEEERPGLIGGGHHERDVRRVRIFVVNSARTHLASEIRADLAQGRIVLLICDECHHYLSRENRKIFSFLKTENMGPDLSGGAEWTFSRQYASLGLSATPFSDEKEDFPCHALGDVIFRYHYTQAVREGVVAPCAVCNVSVPFLKEERERYEEISEKIRLVLRKLYQSHAYLKVIREKQGFMKEVSRIASAADMDPEEPAALFLLLAYQRKQICVMADARIQCTEDLIATLDSHDRILVFTERIDQASQMCRMLKRRFGSCVGIYHSGMTKAARERMLAGFHTREIRILVTCKCLDEGIDVPDANIAIVLSGSAVSRQRIQRLGRVIRRAEDKDTACLYYLYIREAVEDHVFLTGESAGDYMFDLRYDPSDRGFENELYLCAAAALMQEASGKGMNARETEELRSCILEGMTRADYLLPDKSLERKINQSATMHKRNYWTVQRAIERRIRGNSQS